MIVDVAHIQGEHPWSTDVMVTEGDEYAMWKVRSQMKRNERKELEGVEKEMKAAGMLEEDDRVSGVVTIGGWGLDSLPVGMTVEVETKHKTVDKKVRPAAVPLPEGAEKARETKGRKPDALIGTTFTEDKLAGLHIGQGDFLTEAEDSEWRRMIGQYGKAFAYSQAEMGSVNPEIVKDLVLWTIPHQPWSMKPLRVPQAWMPKFLQLLKEKIDAGVLERGYGPYSNRWFCVPKKNGKLRLIQDLQPTNKVTIRDLNIPPDVDGFAERFAGRSIYSLCDLFSGYDQFPLAPESRDLTAIQTPLGLYRMTVTPMGGTNSVAHFQRAMHEVLREHIPDWAEAFLDDIGIKGAKERDETEVRPGVRRFVWEHLERVKMIFEDLIKAKLTLSPEKSFFAQKEVVVVGHLCNGEGRLPEPSKVEAISKWKACKTQTEVRGFLGACLFFRIWIKDLATIAEPLFRLLKKHVRFNWGDEQTRAMTRLKEALISAPILRPPEYGVVERPLILSTDASPFGSGWMLGQEDEQGRRFACRYGAKTFNEREQRYSQIKRELLAVVHALKKERHYLYGQAFILEVDAAALVGMINNPDLPDMAMMRWIAFIRTYCPDVRTVPGKANLVPDGLSRQRNHLEGEDNQSDEDLEEYIEGRMNEITVEQCKRNDLMRVYLIEGEYNGEFLKIGRYLETLKQPEGIDENEIVHLGGNQ